jgi:hypothetical protein
MLSSGLYGSPVGIEFEHGDSEIGKWEQVQLGAYAARTKTLQITHSATAGIAIAVFQH